MSNTVSLGQAASTARGGGNQRSVERGFGSIRQLPSGRYQARYTGPDGTEHRAPVTFAAKFDATAWLSMQQAAITEHRWKPAPPYGVVPTWGYRVYPTGFAGGASVGTVALPTANYCVSHAAGSTFSKSSTAAISWSNGVSISAAIGINLSAKTGYSTQSKLDYTFSSARRLCGQNAHPAGTPFTIVVKA